MFTQYTISAPPSLVIENATFVESFSGGANQDGSIDPGETIFETVAIRNTDGQIATNITATIFSDTPGVTLIESASAYPDLPPGRWSTNTTAFAYRLSSQVPCGSTLTFTHFAITDDLRFTNTFTHKVGHLEITSLTTNLFESGDTLKPIPDGGSTFSANTIAVPGTIKDVDVLVRIDHEWV